MAGRLAGKTAVMCLEALFRSRVSLGSRPIRLESRLQSQLPESLSDGGEQTFASR
jgi:hypothetical protein